MLVAVGGCWWVSIGVDGSESTPPIYYPYGYRYVLGWSSSSGQYLLVMGTVRDGLFVVGVDFFFIG